MRILILDDEEVRHEAFSHRYDGHEVVGATTYSQFIRYFSEGSPWDLIHLDHDLGEPPTADSYVDGWGGVRAYTGIHAARTICEAADHLLPREVIVHSQNPLGSQAMVAELRARGIISSRQPFDLK